MQISSLASWSWSLSAIAASFTTSEAAAVTSLLLWLLSDLFAAWVWADDVVDVELTADEGLTVLGQDIVVVLPGEGVSDITTGLERLHDHVDVKVTWVKLFTILVLVGDLGNILSAVRVFDRKTVVLENVLVDSISDSSWNLDHPKKEWKEKQALNLYFGASSKMVTLSSNRRGSENAAVVCSDEVLVFLRRRAEVFPALRFIFVRSSSSGLVNGAPLILLQAVDAEPGCVWDVIYNCRLESWFL